MAAQNVFSGVCAVLLERNANVNVNSENGAAPLHVAAQNDYLELCTMLLESKSNINEKGRNGTTPNSQKWSC